MKIYCSHCGAGASYSMQKPAFCGSCGKPYMASPASNIKRTVQNEPAVASTNEEEDDFEVEIDSLQFDLKTYGSNVHKLGDIIGSSDEGDIEESRERDSSYTKRNIEQDFLNDAGSIKKS
jgi:hypothetical protein